MAKMDKDIKAYVERPPLDDPEALYAWTGELFRKLTGKDPTPEDRAASRKRLGLPPEPKV
jgi:hypothetical protein